MILLLASGLKARLLLSGDAVAGARTGWEWDLEGLAVPIEWMLATWLLSGVAGRLARLAAIYLLAIFACVSAWRLLAGRSDCGCFGRLQVYPLWTLLLDLTALWLFLWLGQRRVFHMPQSDLRRITAVVVLALGIPVIGGAIESSAAPPGAVVLSSPSDWVGEPLSLLRYADAGDRADLTAGARTVIIFSSQCGECKDLIQRIEATRSKLARGSGWRLVDIAPPDASSSSSPPASLGAIHLSPHHIYFVPVPLKLRLQNGIVEAVEKPPLEQ